MKSFDEAIGYDCAISGYNLRYYRAGKGETVLLIHGITSYSFIWGEVFDALSLQYDVIAVDLFGCGHSDKTLLLDHSLKNHAKLLWSFLEQLNVNRLHIVGHDVGGGIAQIMLASEPQKVLSATLVNSVAYDFWPVQPIVAMRTPVIRQLAMASLDIGIFRMMITKGMFHKEKVDREMIEKFNVSMQTKEGRKAFLHFANCLNNQDLVEIEQQLREVTSPVLIIRGDADIYLSSTISEKLHSEIPTSRLIQIPTAGHFAMLDEPDLLTGFIQSFFKDSDDGSL